jgi:beta-glucuronidase
LDPIYKVLKSLGANFVRGCHYTQDQRFLDLCDEEGILVWNEALAWGNSPSQLLDPVGGLQV